MKSLPLFHQLTGKPVLVLGEGDAAAAKCRLVERSGARLVSNVEEALEAGARIAFVAHDDPALVERDVARLKEEGLIVNAVDRPDLCDFTTPSVLDRDPVLIAFGTGGASAGLAKALRLRFDRLLPGNLGDLAKGLFAARNILRQRWPDPADRRRAIDAALEEGGVLDPMRDSSALAVADWANRHGDSGEKAQSVKLEISSDDPDDLTLRQARLLGAADYIVCDRALGEGILARCRADAVRLHELPDPAPDAGLIVIITTR